MSTFDLETLLKLVWSLGSGEAADRIAIAPGSAGEAHADQGRGGVVGRTRWSLRQSLAGSSAKRAPGGLLRSLYSL